jgi:hypothetical protein
MRTMSQAQIGMRCDSYEATMDQRRVTRQLYALARSELDLIGDSKTDHNLLGAACLLKYFQSEGRFPSQKQDIPSAVIVHLAQQLGIIPEKIIPYDWEGRMIKTHRAAIRSFLGYRETTQQDEDTLVSWLCQEVLTEQRQEEALLAAVYAHYKRLHIEPPTPDRLHRLLHTALHQFDEQFCASASSQLTQETRERLDALLVTRLPEEHQPSSPEQSPQEDSTMNAPAQHARSAWQQLKQDAGHMTVEHVLEEIAKLECIEQLGLPATLFAQASSKLLNSIGNGLPSKISTKFVVTQTRFVGPCWPPIVGGDGKRSLTPSLTCSST